MWYPRAGGRMLASLVITWAGQAMRYPDSGRIRNISSREIKGRKGRGSRHWRRNTAFDIRGSGWPGGKDMLGPERPNIHKGGFFWRSGRRDAPEAARWLCTVKNSEARLLVVQRSFLCCPNVRPTVTVVIGGNIAQSPLFVPVVAAAHCDSECVVLFQKRIPTITNMKGHAKTPSLAEDWRYYIKCRHHGDSTRRAEHRISSNCGDAPVMNVWPETGPRWKKDRRIPERGFRKALAPNRTSKDDNKTKDHAEGFGRELELMDLPEIHESLPSEICESNLRRLWITPQNPVKITQNDFDGAYQCWSKAIGVKPEYAGCIQKRRGWGLSPS
ncbi:hypothetical protein B0H17DRAFT_1148629 [Mycena rosella]|uniref:Uncharacterized protein n=1 Tax=Mycena rosella TaxID=1033263 RepID=A0AAD7FTX7_MYCRO|nr:hypothetical protein B0H17DRAFT_1148629 [Mycena rosella]